MEGKNITSEFGMIQKSMEHENRFEDKSVFCKFIKNSENLRKNEKTEDKSK